MRGERLPIAVKAVLSFIFITLTIGALAATTTNSTKGAKSKLVCDPVEVSSFTLMNAGTQGPIRLLQDGDTINLANLGSISVRADVCDESSTANVDFILNGSNIQNESIAPYAIAGDNNADYTAWNPSIGNYTLMAVPYSAANGSQGIAHSIDFTIIDQNLTAPDCNGNPGGSAYIDDCGECVAGNTGKSPNAAKDSCGVCFGDGSSCANSSCDPVEVTSLSIMDAASGSVIGSLKDQDTINLAQVSDFSLRADVCDASDVGSVEFVLNGSSIQVENLMPYSIAGDNSGSYKPWNPGVGNYTLTAIPFPNGNTKGGKGVAYTVDFSIVDENSATGPEPDCNGEPGGSAYIDDCGECVSGNTGKTANYAKDSCGVCYGDGSSCATGSCNSVEVVSFTLMYAGNQGVISPLNNGDTINLDQTSDFSVRADVCDESATAQVDFFLNGDNIQTEGISPYAIAGDNSNGFNAWNPGVGNYNLKAVPTASNGSQGVAYSINFTIVDENSTQPTSDCNGDPGGLAYLDDCGECVGGNTGKTANFAMDSCGVCYGDGSSCATISCNSVQVTSFTLMYAGTQGSIGQLNGGDTINLNQTSDFSIRANVCDESATAQVDFILDGSNIQTEGIAPYAIAGDNSKGFNAWNPGVGNYTLKAVPSGSNGSQGVAYSINFTIVDENSTQPTSDCNGDPGGSAFIDDCGECVGGNTGKSPNYAKDSCGVCFGDGSSCVTSGPGCTGNEVVSFSLMDAGSGNVIRTLQSQDTIDMDIISDFSVRANVCDEDVVESVEFLIDGNTVQLENIKPYSIAGDNNGSYTPWNPGEGTYQLVGVPNSDANGTGQDGIALSIDLTIVDQNNNQTTTDCNGDPNGTAFIDDCGVCVGGNTGRTANADKDSCGVCFGDGSSCAGGGSGCTNFPGGRIALVSDGNISDQDDWGATAFAIAMVHYAGLDNNLVFVGHSCLWKNKNLSWEEEMDTSSFGTMLRFGMDTSVVHSFRRDLTGSVNALTSAINASSANSPLWIYGGGPMDVIYRAIDGAQQSKRQYVKIMSHSQWNENSKYGGLSYNWDDIKNSFSSDGVSFLQILDQNTSNGHLDFRAEDESYWNWMYNSGNPDWVWLRDRNCDACLGDFDISDAGMMYWLISGGPNGGCETCGTNETENLFKNPCPSGSLSVNNGNGSGNTNQAASKMGISNKNDSTTKYGLLGPGSRGEELTVFPNPNNGSFNVVLPGAFHGQVEVILRNQLGVPVLQEREQLSGRELFMEATENLKRGVYILEVIVEDVRYHTKVVIE